MLVNSEKSAKHGAQLSFGKRQSRR